MLKRRLKKLEEARNWQLGKAGKLQNCPSTKALEKALSCSKHPPPKQLNKQPWPLKKEQNKQPKQLKGHPDEEDARWQRELEAAKQAEIEAQAAVEQAKIRRRSCKKRSRTGSSKET